MCLSEPAAQAPLWPPAGPAQGPVSGPFPGLMNGRSAQGGQEPTGTRSQQTAPTSTASGRTPTGAGLAGMGLAGHHLGGCVSPPLRPGRCSLGGTPFGGRCSSAPCRDPEPPGRGAGPAGGHVPSCLSARSLVASMEGRARPPRGLPGTMRTRSLLFILLYLFSDLLTNWGGGRTRLSTVRV